MPYFFEKIHFDKVRKILTENDLSGITFFKSASVVELADTPDLGSGALRRGGSSPFARIGLLRGNNSVVECNLAKVDVAGSNPVSRS